MSHLLLVLCFAQSITGSIGKCAETLKMRPGVCHNSDLGVGIMPSQNLHQNSQLTGEFPGTIDVGYDNKKKPITNTKLEPLFQNMVKSKSPFTGETPSFSSILSVLVTVFSTTEHSHCREQSAPKWLRWCALCYLILSQTWTAGLYNGSP